MDWWDETSQDLRRWRETLVCFADLQVQSVRWVRPNICCAWSGRWRFWWFLCCWLWWYRYRRVFLWFLRRRLLGRVLLLFNRSLSFCTRLFLGWVAIVLLLWQLWERESCRFEWACDHRWWRYVFLRCSRDWCYMLHIDWFIGFRLFWVIVLICSIFCTAGRRPRLDRRTRGWFEWSWWCRFILGWCRCGCGWPRSWTGQIVWGSFCRWVGNWGLRKVVLCWSRSSGVLLNCDFLGRTAKRLIWVCVSPRYLWPGHTSCVIWDVGLVDLCLRWSLCKFGCPWFIFEIKNI